MRAAVVYESLFGRTREVAEAVAEGLRAGAPGAAVDCTPVVDAGPAYVSLLRAVGFREEGVVRAHALMRGQSCDLAVLGVVREEFEAWCQTNERRLAI